MSHQRTTGILHEISTYVPLKNKEDTIEMRAHHVISSAMFLMETIDECYSHEEAEQLKKRLLSSIRGGDPDRFKRSIRKVKESRDGR